MFAKSVIYDKQQWAAANASGEPIQYLNLDDKKYDVSQFRYIRIDWQENAVYGGNSKDEGGIWLRLKAV